MQIIEFGNGWALAAAGLSWLIIALALFFAIRLLLWLIRRSVGEKNYPHLTALLALTGALAALYQLNSSISDKRQDQARALAFARLLGRDLQILTSRPVPTSHVGNIPDPFLVEPEDLGARTDRIKEIANAFDHIEPKELPSSDAMVAVVRLRAVSKRIVASAQAGVEKTVPVNFEQFMPELLTADQALDRERDRLYPVYRFGDVLFTPNSEIERR